jgi:maltose O-acetyltransferase
MAPEVTSSKILRLLRYDWPVHFVLLLTSWLPDNVIFYRLRGWMLRRFLGSCGGNLRIGRNVYLHNPKNIDLGQSVFMAYGCCLIANAEIRVGSEAMLGPYCVLAAGNHTRTNKSFRYGASHSAPVTVGEGTWIGAHSTLTAGVTVGSGTVIAAGAVVTKDIPGDVMAAGVPARVIKQLENETDCQVLELSR